MAGLAHESRNALQRSQACLEMLSRRVQDRPEAVELISRIQKAQDDLHRLYEEVGEYAALVDFSPQVCHLSTILYDAWEHLAVRRQQKNIQLRENADQLDLYCEVDRFAIRQVFRNILENALSACTDPVTIVVQYSESELNGRPAIRISIHDNGPGLTPEQRQKIFDEFFTTKTHGTGLGMAICKRFVEAHAGQIEVGSNSPEVAEFVVNLPRRQA